MSNLKNINLDVAKFAMSCVENVIKNPENDKDKKETNNKKIKLNPKDYKSLARKMSALIQKNGLIGTLVFNLSKLKKEHHKEILKNIIEWNKQNSKINDIQKFDKGKFIFTNNNNDEIKVIMNYIEWITTLNPVEYRLITKEMITLFGWIKRFADGMIEGEE